MKEIVQPDFLPKDIPDGCWSFDPEQKPIVIYSPPLGHSCYNFKFAGWYFRDTGIIYQELNSKKGTGHLLLFAILHNPENIYDYFSFHNYSYPSVYTKEFAAAWLIAHWYEHYMHTCPCQINDAKPSNFRFACIETLLACCPPNLEFLP